jgi:hypothetical protein
MPTVEWPEGKRCCSTVVVDYSVPCTNNGITEEAISAAEALYGDSVGGEWLLDTLAAYGIKATFAVTPGMARRFPDIVRRADLAGHEIAVGGMDKKDISTVPREKERQFIAEATQVVVSLSKAKPSGWFSLPRTTDDYPGGFISPNSMSLLKEAGYRYFGNGMADDIPYYMTLNADSGVNILTMPYYYHFDSQFFIYFPGIGRGSGLVNIEKLEQNWQMELDGALHFGRQLAMVVQPCLMYWGSAYDVLENMFKRLRDDERVWQVTSRQCAEWWLRRYPA